MTTSRADDRRYMTHEQRAADDHRYRGTIPVAERTVCHCGLTSAMFPDGRICPAHGDWRKS